MLNVVPDINNSWNERVDKKRYVIESLDYDCLEDIHNIITDYQNVSSDKENTLMLSFCSVKDDHFVKDSFNGAYGISLDIDDGSLKEFKDKWEYECIIHTTHSHKSGLKGDGDYFRVIIPFYFKLSVKSYDKFITGFMEEFDWIDLDKTFKDKPRGFILPPKDGLVEIIHGNPLPYKNIIKSQILQKAVIEVDVKRAKTFRKKTCINYPKVKYYLNKTYTTNCGNGDSNISLYKAIYCCVANDDENTLDIVLDKARGEGWTENELNYKLKSAGK